MAALSILIAVIVASVLLVYWFMPDARTRELVNKIPGVPPIPILGNAHLFKSGGVGKLVIVIK